MSVYWMIQTHTYMCRDREQSAWISAVHQLYTAIICIYFDRFIYVLTMGRESFYAT